MGKVGSVTIKKSLRKAGFTAEHIHYIDEENVNGINTILSESGATQDQHFLDFTHEARKNLPLWLASGMKIIMGVRDPVARTLSGIFQNYELLNQRKPAGDVTAYAEQLNQIGIYKSTLEWFDREPKKVIGFDVFQSPFNKHLGYQIYQCGLGSILVYRLGLSDEILEAVLNNFSGREVTLRSGNVAKDKDYADVYARLKTELSIDKELLNEIYQSRYSTHFWSSDENSSFIKRWSQETI